MLFRSSSASRAWLIPLVLYDHRLHSLDTLCTVCVKWLTACVTFKVCKGSEVEEQTLIYKNGAKDLPDIQGLSKFPELIYVTFGPPDSKDVFVGSLHWLARKSRRDQDSTK